MSTNECPAPGVHYDMPDAQYRAIPAISQTGLKILGEQSPAAYRWQQEHPKTPTDAMILGSAVDCLCLEPDTFAARFEVANGLSWPNAWCPECSAAPKAPCTKKDGCVASKCHSGRRELHIGDGRMVLAADRHYQAQQIVDAVLRHPTAGPLVGTTQHQVSLVWQDAGTGVWCKGRLDMKRPDLLGDLKTCRAGSAHPGAWARYAHGLHYEYQAAFYCDGWEALTGERLPWVWAAVEVDAPFHVGIYQADDPWIWAGREAYRRALAVYAHCVEMDQWPGYSPDVQIIALPAWAAAKTTIESTDNSWMEEAQ